jgi:hypothetical protein
MGVAELAVIVSRAVYIVSLERVPGSEVFIAGVADVMTVGVSFVLLECLKMGEITVATFAVGHGFEQ